MLKEKTVITLYPEDLFRFNAILLDRRTRPWIFYPR